MIDFQYLFCSASDGCSIEKRNALWNRASKYGILDTCSRWLRISICVIREIRSHDISPGSLLALACVSLSPSCLDFLDRQQLFKSGERCVGPYPTTDSTPSIDLHGICRPPYRKTMLSRSPSLCPRAFPVKPSTFFGP